MSLIFSQFSRYIRITPHFRQVYLNSPNPLYQKYKLDRSKVPVLNENEIEEQFVHGHGPGDFTVKCHETRSLEQNRRRARELMIQKLDKLINGQDSLEEQKKRIDEIKKRTYESKRRKLAKLKEEWKKREQLDEGND